MNYCSLPFWDFKISIHEEVTSEWKLDVGDALWITVVVTWRWLRKICIIRSILSTYNFPVKVCTSLTNTAIINLLSEMEMMTSMMLQPWEELTYQKSLKTSWQPQMLTSSGHSHDHAKMRFFFHLYHFTERSRQSVSWWFLSREVLFPECFLVWKKRVRAPV